MEEQKKVVDFEAQNAEESKVVDEAKENSGKKDGFFERVKNNKTLKKVGKVAAVSIAAAGVGYLGYKVFQHVFATGDVNVASTWDNNGKLISESVTVGGKEVTDMSKLTADQLNKVNTIREHGKSEIEKLVQQSASDAASAANEAADAVKDVASTVAAEA